MHQHHNNINNSSSNHYNSSHHNHHHSSMSSNSSQPNSTSSSVSCSGSPPTSSISSISSSCHQISKKVTVPYQVVGLVVGPKGSTIKRIQQSTNTYIVTPSRDSQPVFEIQGQAECVEAAKAEIENYIMLRTTSTVSNVCPSSQSSSSSSTSSSCSSKEDFCCASLSALMIGDASSSSSSSASSSSSSSNHPLMNPSNGAVMMSDYVANLMSPQSSSLFQSVVSVVDDYAPSSSGKCATDLGKLVSILFDIIRHYLLTFLLNLILSDRFRKKSRF